MKDLTESFSGRSLDVLRLIRKVMNAIVIVSGCIMALTFFFVVILRYGFDADLFAYEEWLMTIAFWMFFIGSALATHNRCHINADILGIFIRNPTYIWYRTLLVQIIELMILGYLSYLGIMMIVEEIMAYPMWQKSIALKIPFMVPRLGIAIGFIMMTLYTLLFIYLLLKKGPSNVLLSEDIQKSEKMVK